MALAVMDGWDRLLFTSTYTYTYNYHGSDLGLFHRDVSGNYSLGEKGFGRRPLARHPS